MEKGLNEYTQAKDISFQKMLGMGGVEFTEFQMKDGVKITVSHFAMPITIKNLKKLEALKEQIDELRYNFGTEAEAILKKMTEAQKKFTEDMPAEISEKITKEINELEKEYKKKEKKYKAAILDKKLDVAVLCFCRTEETNKEDISEWIDMQSLERICEIADGMSYPPKRLPEPEEKVM